MVSASIDNLQKTYVDVSNKKVEFAGKMTTKVSVEAMDAATKT